MPFSAIQTPTSDKGHWEIVKYYDADTRYEVGAGDHLLESYSFKECGVDKTRFSDRDELALSLSKLTTFNPTVGYGAVRFDDIEPTPLVESIETKHG